jgi:hypothetical protein
MAPMRLVRNVQFDSLTQSDCQWLTASNPVPLAPGLWPGTERAKDQRHQMESRRGIWSLTLKKQPDRPTMLVSLRSLAIIPAFH